MAIRFRAENGPEPLEGVVLTASRPSGLTRFSHLLVLPVERWGGAQAGSEPRSRSPPLGDQQDRLLRAGHISTNIS